ncbi:hypothetical protein IRZ53_07195 [Pseudomonas fulva]|uniref:hypothetical protein n=1 Tax=Pseudomonas fulva TaxID=47880 RepID=UPI0007D74BA1|nr:hypothetical protein [Pseudomonas fulva]MBF8674861.1 hypothetical protein [Pseudomonas fulva]MBF8696580.1 hypothetical protein [Pseudomonas fulva]OAK63101.1 hypothetical protein A3K88_02910 [Pseudomonas putida]
MSQQQAQLDALEHLLIGILKASGSSIPSKAVFEKAESSLMSENGPPGTDEKTAARKYLEHLKQQF